MEKQISVRINNVRTILCLGVIAIHSSISVQSDVCKILIDFFSMKLTIVCVPAFFFISGYLYGNRYTSSAPADVRNYMQKKVKTLLVPYILWNLIAFLIRFAVQHSFVAQYTSGGEHFSGVGDFLWSVFFVPELVPLWFLRNLFIFSILYPAIRYCIERSWIATLSVLLILDEFAGFSGIFMFGLGVMMAIKVRDYRFNEILDKSKILLLVYVATMLLITIFPVEQAIFYDIIIFLAQIVGTAGILAVASTKAKKTIFSAGAVSFLYFAHGIFSPYIIKGLKMLIDIDSALATMLRYVIGFVLIVAVTYLFYLLIKRLSNKTAALLTGFRENRGSNVM